MSLRHRLNDAAGRWATHRTNRKVYNSRVLLVADHWDGSVQQFYHFLLGYLAPVALWVREHPDVAISMRGCGPMDPWLALVGERVDLEVIPPGTALHMVVGDRMAHKVLPGLDDPSAFDRDSLLRGADAIRELMDLPPGGSGGPHTIVIDRATSEDFYHGPASETHMSGGERRSTPNLRDVVDLVHGAEVVDLARIEPKDQIRLMGSTTVLVGQHGAGLVHMLWMTPGSLIVEIAPPLPPEVVHLFEQLARCLGHRYVRVPQETVHAPVDLEAIARAIRSNAQS
ncbi:MAG TPA: hypothetical protein DCQ36_10445 [Actinobacteria bacterium]|nr:hypothetical protein [Actinomycetota bacterium]